MSDSLTVEFRFAGFGFPRYIAQLPRGPMSLRLQRMRHPLCGPYYHAPKPSQAGRGVFFYLGSDFMPGLRWDWADEVAPRSVKHQGWYIDASQPDETLRGLVMRLPHGRGFLAGWSFGEGMASDISTDIYSDIKEAAIAADDAARDAAERERDYQERERLEAEASEDSEV
jgi:hypothetical protein